MSINPENHLTQEQFRRLFKAAKAGSRRDEATFLIAYRHGLRASEIGLLTKDDLDFHQAQITNPRREAVHQQVMRSGKVV